MCLSRSKPLERLSNIKREKYAKSRLRDCRVQKAGSSLVLVLDTDKRADPIDTLSYQPTDFSYGALSFGRFVRHLNGLFAIELDILERMSDLLLVL